MIPHMINEVKWTTKYESMSYLVAAAFLIHFEASQVIWDKEYNHPRKKGGNTQYDILKLQPSYIKKEKSQFLTLW